MALALSPKVASWATLLGFVSGVAVGYALSREAVQAGQDGAAALLVLVTSVTCVLVLLLAGRLGPARSPGRA